MTTVDLRRAAEVVALVLERVAEGEDPADAVPRAATATERAYAELALSVADQWSCRRDAVLGGVSCDARTVERREGAC